MIEEAYDLVRNYKLAEIRSSLKRLIKGLRLRLWLRAIGKLRIGPSRDMKPGVLYEVYELGRIGLRSSISI